MTAGDEPGRLFERILVPLDPSEETAGALDLVTSLAAALHSRLEALFIEDPELLALAALPFTREMTLAGAPQAIDPERMERAFKARAAEAQRRLASLARMRSLAWEFRTVRGELEVELWQAAGTGDLVAIGRAPGPVRSPRGLGRAEFAASARCAGSILLTGRQGELARSAVTVLYCETAAGQRALRVAARVARAMGKPVSVLLPRPDAEDGRAVLQRIAREVGADIGLALDLTPGVDAEDIVERVCAIRSGLVIGAVELFDARAEALERLAAEVHSALLLVRE